MNTRQALAESVRRERMAAMAKSVVTDDLRKQLIDRLDLFEFELGVKDWARAATQSDYIGQLLRSLAENEATP